MKVMSRPLRLPRFTLQLFLVLSLLYLPLSSDPTAATSPQRLQTLLKYLQQDIFLTPGVGLKKVKIGQPVTQVLKIWGQPGQQQSTGFLGRLHQWLYRGLGNTDIIVTSLNGQVNRLSFRAHLVSPYQTVNGLQFGMLPVQVRSLFGSGQTGDDGQLRYPTKGLAVEFKEGRVQIITIFQPRTP